MSEDDENSTVRTNGTQTASAIRALGLRAKKVGDELNDYAEEVASAIEAASVRVATAVESYVGTCGESKDWLGNQEKVLSKLPDTLLVTPEEKSKKRVNSVTAPEIQKAFAAVEDAVNNARRQ
jgi:hypothetical protein